jgi:hypothetical protein
LQVVSVDEVKRSITPGGGGGRPPGLLDRVEDDVQLSFGVPAILAVYCWVIWNKGFGPEDRVLFRKNAAA